jgi:hypothetical protein
VFPFVYLYTHPRNMQHSPSPPLIKSPKALKATLQQCVVVIIVIK